MEGERERQKNRQTDRQTDRQTGVKGRGENHPRKKEGEVTQKKKAETQSITVIALKTWNGRKTLTPLKNT